MLLSRLINNAHMFSPTTVDDIMRAVSFDPSSRYSALLMRHHYRFISVNWLADLGVVDTFQKELAKSETRMLAILAKGTKRSSCTPVTISPFVLLKHLIAYLLQTRNHAIIPAKFYTGIVDNEARMMDHVSANLAYKHTACHCLEKHFEQMFPETLNTLSIAVNQSGFKLREVLLTGNVDVREQVRIPMGFTIDPILQIITFIY